MRPYILNETNYFAIKDQKYDLAVLPWGATEAHNFHLPYSTDNIESELMVAESARIAWESGAKLIVLPNIPYGVNTGQRDIHLDVGINPSTQLAILSDIADVLNHQGIYKLMIFNSHGGNDFKAKKNKIAAFSEGWVWSERKWFQITNDTGVGDPCLATQEKGESYFRGLTVKIANVLIQLCSADINDLYD